ncbi:MAG: carboxypeptidase-like regulatory domain-containing protein, partial [Hymenobacteraceae bacterium]|nr:carboxypeptidase-like regulatory domain-containing protein [Hymenobacteraceae bacterium]
MAEGYNGSAAGFAAHLGAKQQATPQDARTVTGAVTDENGAGLPGVAVVLKGTTRGTSTDVNGNFTLSVPESGGTLVFSFIGYQTQEMAIGNQSTLNVSLMPDT